MADDRVIPGERIGTISVFSENGYAAWIIGPSEALAQAIAGFPKHGDVEIPVYQWNALPENYILATYKRDDRVLVERE